MPVPAAAEGTDPSNLDRQGRTPLGPEPADLPLPSLLTAIELLQVFTSPDAVARLTAPGAVHALIIPEPQRLERISATFIDLTEALHALPALAGVGIDDLRVISSSPPRGRSRSAAELKRSFETEVSQTVADGDSALLLCDSAHAIPDIARTVMVDADTLPQLTTAMVLDLLASTHGATGSAARDEIAALLPPDAALQALPESLICHAFRAATSQAVAHRLARHTATFVVSDPPWTLDDVKGLPDICGRLQDIIADLSDWKAGLVRWEDVSASVLLHGPPGTGKTMLAEALAGSAGAHFVATSYTDLQAAGHLGDYLKAMATVVAEAVARAPSVIFFDELDSFGTRTRDPGSKLSRYMTAVINDLLQQLTRLNAAGGVIVVAATNHMDQIDPAILRAGRFDMKLQVPMPDKAGVRDILAHHLGSEVPIDEAAVVSLFGKSGADLAHIARDAKARARRAQTSLTADHLHQTVAEHAPPICAEHLRRIAAHEAGHIVAAAVLDLPLPVRARITPTGGEVLRPARTSYTVDIIKKELVCLMAGRAAEQLLIGDISSGSGSGQQSDLELATALLVAQEYQWGLGESSLVYTPMATSQWHGLSETRRQVINHHLKAAEAQARKLLAEHKDTLVRVTEALLKERELDKVSIVELLNPLGTIRNPRSHAQSGK
ncbi:AAA family ATPase [Thalassorhabdomicrobium marinisediminis]|uniref:AAA family ATPase n=1 Tax=Thalassorhabdomicrobium marinisediminis TaxID=2170577 RepID=UPI0024913CA0|nr:AAA family ATPase [Thalassorhabdomicrobium marinisediminis]